MAEMELVYPVFNNITFMTNNMTKNKGWGLIWQYNIQVTCLNQLKITLDKPRAGKKRKVQMGSILNLKSYEVTELDCTFFRGFIFSFEI